MYLHLGNDVVIRTEDIIAMFDIDACTVSKKTRDFLIVCEQDNQIKVYISQLSAKTLSRRELRIH